MPADFSDHSDYYGSPQHPAYGPPPPRKSSSVLLISIFAGIGVLVILLCCGGGGGVMWFGLEMIEEEIGLQLRDNPILRKHVGEIQTFEMDTMASLAQEDNDTFIYQVQGDKGSGELTVTSITNDAGKEEIVAASLRLPGGETVDLLDE